MLKFILQALPSLQLVIFLLKDFIYMYVSYFTDERIVF